LSSSNLSILPMLFISIILLLLSNAITSRRDKSILYLTVTITILLISAFICYDKLFIFFLDKSIAKFGELLHITATNLDSLYIIFSISDVSNDNIADSMHCYKSYFLYVSLLFMAVVYIFIISTAHEHTSLHILPLDMYGAIITIVDFFLYKVKEPLILLMKYFFPIKFLIPCWLNSPMLCSGSSDDKGKGKATQVESDGYPFSSSDKNNDKGKTTQVESDGYPFDFSEEYPYKYPDNNNDKNKATQVESDGYPFDFSEEYPYKYPDKNNDKGKGKATQVESDEYPFDFSEEYPYKYPNKNNDKGKGKATQVESDEYPFDFSEEYPYKYLDKNNDKGKGKATQVESNEYPLNYPDNNYDSDTDSEYQRQIQRAKFESLYANKVGESSTSNQRGESSTSYRIGESSTSNKIGESYTSNKTDEYSQNGSEYVPENQDYLNHLAYLKDKSVKLAEHHNNLKIKLDDKDIPGDSKNELVEIKGKHLETTKEIEVVKDILKNRGVECESDNNYSSDEGSFENSEGSYSDNSNRPNKRVKFSDEDNKHWLLLPITREFIFSFSPIIKIFLSFIGLFVLCLIDIELFEFYIYLIGNINLLIIYFIIYTFYLIYKQYHNCIKLYNSYLNKDYLHSPRLFLLLLFTCTILFLYKIIKLFLR